MFKKIGAALAVVAMLCLGGCAENFVKVSVQDTSSQTALAAAKNVTAAAEATGNQPGIVALGAQVAHITQDTATLLRLRQDTEKAVEDRDAAAVEKYAKQAITTSWTLIAQAKNMYDLAKQSPSECAQDSIVLAQAILNFAETEDEVNQLSLDYAKDYHLLFSTPHQNTYNALVKHEVGLKASFDASVQKLLGSLSKEQAAGTPVPFNAPVQGTAHYPVKVSVLGTTNEKQKAAFIKTLEEILAHSTVGEYPDVSLTVTVRSFGDYTFGDAALLLLIGKTSDHKADFSASVKKGNGPDLTLKVDTFTVEATDTETLMHLMASRIVGQAQVALLREHMAP